MNDSRNESPKRQAVVKVINIVSKGLAIGDASKNLKKKHALSVPTNNTERQRNRSTRLVGVRKTSWGEEDLNGIAVPHKDGLIVTLNLEA